VRELQAKRVWFAEPLLSSATAEIQRLIVKAKQWAEQLGKPVVLWVSDKQDAFVQAIAAEFPEVPHRYCQNHFLRDVAKPLLQADSHAKVQLRRKVRGLRAIERDLLAPQQATAPAATTEVVVTPTKASVGPDATATSLPEASAVVLDYCAAVRGILNDDQGGPLEPPGLRMADALLEVRDSLQRNLEAKKGGAPRGT
jgi:hypothetical protein